MKNGTILSVTLLGVGLALPAATTAQGVNPLQLLQSVITSIQQSQPQQLPPTSSFVALQALQQDLDKIERPDADAGTSIRAASTLLLSPKTLDD